jgi:hypothetical protein
VEGVRYRPEKKSDTTKVVPIFAPPLCRRLVMSQPASNCKAHLIVQCKAAAYRKRETSKASSGVLLQSQILRPFQIDEGLREGREAAQAQR